MIAVMGSLTFLEDYNQYKAVYIVVLPFAPIIALGMNALLDRIPCLSVRSITALAIVVVLAITPTELLWLAYIDTPKASDDQYEFEGTDISYAASATFEPTVFEWLQRKTPLNSAIIVSPRLYDRSQYDISATEMIFATVSQRRLYYGAQAVPSKYLQYSQKTLRQSIRTRLTSCQTKKSVSARTLDGPLYLLVVHSNAANCNLASELQNMLCGVKSPTRPTPSFFGTNRPEKM